MQTRYSSYRYDSLFHIKLKSVKVCLFCLVLFFICNAEKSYATQPIEGLHYREIDKASALPNGDIVHFFSFSSYRSYLFDKETKYLEYFRKQNMKIKLVPVTFKQMPWMGFGRLFLTLEQVGLSSQYMDAIYYDIHEKHHKEFNLSEICQRLGMNDQLTRKVMTVYKSEAIDKQLKESERLVKRYEVKSVPFLVLESRYLTNAAMARGTRQLFFVAQFLVQKMQPLIRLNQSVTL